MLCYIDRTFCMDETCRKFTKCDRAFTKEIEKAAIEWWGNDSPPIAVYLEPECYEGINDELV